MTERVATQCSVNEGERGLGEGRARVVGGWGRMVREWERVGGESHKSGRGSGEDSTRVGGVGGGSYEGKQVREVRLGHVHRILRPQPVMWKRKRRKRLFFMEAEAVAEVVNMK